MKNPINSEHQRQLLIEQSFIGYCKRVKQILKARGINSPINTNDIKPYFELNELYSSHSAEITAEELYNWYSSHLD